MRRDIDIRKWIIWSLLILHVAWIGNHMRWVANDQINPWRMGGYAMYTVPNLAQMTRVYDANLPDAPLKVEMLHYESATRLTNSDRVFRCADVPASALLAFFDDNRTLIGRNLVFVYSERQFNRPTLQAKRVAKGMVAVIWQDERRFAYVNRFCGKEDTDIATLPEGLSGTLADGNSGTFTLP